MRKTITDLRLQKVLTTKVMSHAIRCLFTNSPFTTQDYRLIPATDKEPDSKLTLFGYVIASINYDRLVLTITDYGKTAVTIRLLINAILAKINRKIIEEDHKSYLIMIDGDTKIVEDWTGTKVIPLMNLSPVFVQ